MEIHDQLLVAAKGEFLIGTAVQAGLDRFRQCDVFGLTRGTNEIGIDARFFKRYFLRNGFERIIKELKMKKAPLSFDKTRLLKLY